MARCDGSADVAFSAVCEVSIFVVVLFAAAIVE
jgi:hypothetical protein